MQLGIARGLEIGLDHWHKNYSHTNNRHCFEKSGQLTNNAFKTLRDSENVLSHAEYASRMLISIHLPSLAHFIIAYLSVCVSKQIRRA